MKLVPIDAPVDIDDPYTMILGWPETMFAVTPEEVMLATFAVPDVAAGDPALVPVDHPSTRLACARFGEDVEPGVALLRGSRWYVRVYVFLRRPTPAELGEICRTAWDGLVIPRL